MAKKFIKYTVIDEHTLELLEDAKSSDQINLLDATKVNSIELLKTLKLQNNESLKLAIEEARTEWGKNKNQSDKQLEDKLKAQFNEKIATNNQAFEKELASKKTEIATLNEKMSNLKTQLEQEQQLKYQAQINQLKQELQGKDNQLNILNLDFENQKLILSGQKDQEISELKNQYDNLNEKYKLLERDKRSLNIKEIGEDLENWCLQQYQQFALSGFEHASFNKTNQPKDNTKPDYLFSAKLPNTDKTLVNVVCEMKSESLVEGTKKKNSDHYAKLDKDRNAFGGPDSYALLISELEKDNDNIIEKIVGYDKMYMVRPAYFISFLSLVYNLSFKFESVIRQNIKFETSEQIVTDFENLKSDIIDKTFKNLKKHAVEINKKIESIKKLCNDIEDEHLEQINKNIITIENKLQNFSINKIIKKIEDLGEN